MLWLALSIAVAFCALLLTEHSSQKNLLGTEVSRKIPHILGGVVIASWPFFVSMRTIAVLGAVFVIATIVVRKFNLFASARTVDRLSWGEPFFGLGVTAVALLNPSKWVFAAAILHLALADAIAALIGKSQGKLHYKVFNYTKTLEGSLAFLLVSALITGWIVFVAPAGFDALWPVVIWLPIITTFLEAFTPFGLDNLLLPVAVTLILKSLQ